MLSYCIAEFRRKHKSDPTRTSILELVLDLLVPLAMSPCDYLSGGDKESASTSSTSDPVRACKAAAVHADIRDHRAANSDCRHNGVKQELAATDRLQNMICAFRGLSENSSFVDI